MELMLFFLESLTLTIKLAIRQSELFITITIIIIKILFKYLGELLFVAVLSDTDTFVADPPIHTLVANPPIQTLLVANPLIQIFMINPPIYTFLANSPIQTLVANPPIKIFMINSMIQIFVANPPMQMTNLPIQIFMPLPSDMNIFPSYKTTYTFINFTQRIWIKIFSSPLLEFYIRGVFAILQSFDIILINDFLFTNVKK